ncbi:acetate--CoA ligase family protein [Streptomyces sp. NPDC048430]|uniref:acetate--CoA ligase family protein n=1 Tax=Streptomyces sp. NPDC048430 TaxID=3155388 RepID=UPI0034266286
MGGGDARRACARERMPSARLDGVLVAQMVTRPGVETTIGMQADPVFGPVVLVGMGGVLVEVMQDVRLRPAPIDVDEAHRMLGQLRGAVVVDGARGGAAVDRPVSHGLLRRCRNSLTTTARTWSRPTSIPCWYVRRA